MDRKISIALYQYTKTHSHFLAYTIFFMKWTPLLIAFFYGLGFFRLIIRDHSLLLSYIGLPIATFIFVTVVRDCLNRPRPFDILPIQPFIPHRSGKSFPSRHTASAVIISLAIGSQSPILGFVFFLLAVLVGLGRIFLGLHYATDIAGAILISLCIHIIGSFIL